MWLLFFNICDWLCYLIPSRRIRENIRHKYLYDWRKKYNALRAAYPELTFRHVQIIKGGWNIGFIIDRKYVFKIRKYFDANIPTQRIEREKRITDAFANISPLRIPKIEIINAGGYTFFKYEFIPGKNMNRYPLRTIKNNAWQWGQQLAEFITAVHNARPAEIADLITDDGDGWNHNDICNNVIVDPKTNKIIGLIDWEYSGWGTLETEFYNCDAFSRKIRKSKISVAIQIAYHVMNRPKTDKKAK